MSLGSVLSVARTALLAQQNVIQTAGQNIANVETEGYSRQRVTLGAAHPEQWPFGTLGTGVVIEDVRRARDEFLDDAWRREASGASAAGTRSELLTSIEAILGEPSETGLAAGLDALWSSWSDLATQPTSQAARSVVLQRAQNVATTLNGFDQRLSDLYGQTAQRLQNTLTDVNALADKIAKLNGDIVSAEVTGRQAPDLRDQRDRAIDSLAKLGEVRVFTDAHGSAQVLLGNNLVVDDVHPKHFQIATDDGATVGIAMVGDPARRLLPLGGEVGALVEALNGGIQPAQERLDRLANSLARTVNAVVTTGVRTGGSTAPPLFVDKGDGRTFLADADPFATVKPAGTITARTIGVSAVLLGDPSGLATSSSAAATTDNDVALALAALREKASVTVGGKTVTVGYWDAKIPADPDDPDARWPAGAPLGEYYRAQTSGLGVQVKDAQGDASVRQALADQTDKRRLAVSGVNLDEELTTLMRAQQAYAAAAKVISAADEMMKVLTSMI